MTHTHTPDDPRVFVFGSNLSGIHGAGAARYAHQKLGADWGQGMMLSTNQRTYAIPTKDYQIITLPLEVIAKFVHGFKVFAAHNSDLRFFVSEIGCGLAGYTPQEISPMFVDSPDNCDLPPGWREQ